MINPLPLLLLLLIHSHLSQPTPPILPNSYTLSFNQTTKQFTTGTTTGTIYMDATNNQQFIHRQNGLHDRYCNTVYKVGNTPCNHYIVESKRFLDFPQKNYCCYCCNSSSGCGIVEPDWMVKSNATFLGYEKLDAETYLKWSIKGLQENLYYHRNDTVQTPRRLAQGTDDIMDFTSYKIGPVDPSIFKLPSYCTSKCGLTTICAALRGEGHATDRLTRIE